MYYIFINFTNSLNVTYMKKIIFAIALSSLLFGCSKDTFNDNYSYNVNRAAGALYEYLIAPSATNSNITTFNNNHYVCVDTRTTLKNKLFVFFPGTTGSPEFYKLIVKKAASLGYHAIGLMYPNGYDMYTASAASSDSTQFGKCRQEIFDGTNQTTGVNVDVNNCIKNRLYKLLVYLNQQYPALNYGQFINGDTVRWSKCSLAGHSQGGGHAFYIAKKVGVERAISFASIDWNTYYGKSAPWVKQSGITPISKFYSINSTKDEVFSYSNVQTQLADMGLTGNAVSIDNNSSPYSSTHKLTTSATPAIALVAWPNHNITCLDQYVPKDRQGAVASSFANAWTYLISY